MRRLPWKELVAALRDVGLSKGDVVLVQSRLYSFDSPEGPNDRERILQFHLSALQEVLGEEGTLSVLTSFEDYGRFGTPFVAEESPSRVGIFSEYVRTRPGTVRSMHPILSITSLGERAQEISGGAHFEGFGYDSPWGRLHRINAKLLAYGCGFREGLTFCHYIEKLYGVPYQYTKIYNAPVYYRRKQIPGPFTMTVRYLDFGIAYNFVPFEERLLATAKGREVAIGRTRLCITTCEEAVEAGIEALRENRYFFLTSEPCFRQGEIPADGPTGPMKESYVRASVTSESKIQAIGGF